MKLHYEPAPEYPDSGYRIDGWPTMSFVGCVDKSGATIIGRGYYAQ